MNCRLSWSMAASVMMVMVMSGGSLGPEMVSGQPPEVTAERPAPDEAAAAAHDELVDAMPVSTINDGVETIPGERTYVVTVHLEEMAQRKVPFILGQELGVQYEVTRGGVWVPNEQVVLPSSPRHVVCRENDVMALKFLVQTTKAPGRNYKLKVFITNFDQTDASNEVNITQ